MIKVSFDYDGTLTKRSVELYAKELIKKGFDVWICTARFGEDKAPSKEWNDDLFMTTDRLGIPRDHIIFCNRNAKYHYLLNKGFLWHLDDERNEVSMIKRYTNSKAFWSFGDNVWKNQCNQAIRNAIKKSSK